MVFVPVIVPHEEPSTRARDLSRRLEEVILTFERQYPGTSPEDIRHAVQVVTTGTGGGADLRRAKLVMALVAGLIAFGVGIFAFVNRQSGTLGGEGEPAMPWVILGMLAAGLGVLAAFRRRS
ncbi:MAG TPA: hypothetical protein VLL51_03040 [Gemmatimonadales bacterium]|nr:hypothetical protein [Gemmatimonadales bacterium]